MLQKNRSNSTFIGFIVVLLSSVLGCQLKQKQDKPQKTNIPSLNIKISDSAFTTVNNILKMRGDRILSSDVVLGDIKRTIMYHDSLFILDENNKLVCFDRKGEIAFNIDAEGNGPGEYIEAHDFSIDSVHQRLNIYDSYSKKLKYYDLQNGDFIDEEKLEIRPQAIASIANYNYFYNPYNFDYPNEPEYHFSLLKSKRESGENKKYFHHNPELANYAVNFGGGHPFYYSNEKLYFTKRFTDTVYQLKTDSVTPKYVVELPHAPSKEYLEKHPDLVELLDSEYTVGLSNLFVNDSLLYFTFNHEGYVNSSFYDLKKQKLIYAGKRIVSEQTRDLPIFAPINGSIGNIIFHLLMQF